MCYWALVWLTLANSTCTKYGAVQAELSAGGRVPGVQDKKLGGHGGTDGGELPEQTLVWLTYRGLVVPSDKGSYFTPVPCWRVGWGSLENTSKDSGAYPGRKTKPWQSRGTE